MKAFSVFSFLALLQAIVSLEQQKNDNKMFLPPMEISYDDGDTYYYYNNHHVKKPYGQQQIPTNEQQQTQTNGLQQTQTNQQDYPYGQQEIQTNGLQQTQTNQQDYPYGQQQTQTNGQNSGQIASSKLQPTTKPKEINQKRQPPVVPPITKPKEINQKHQPSAVQPKKINNQVPKETTNITKQQPATVPSETKKPHVVPIKKQPQVVNPKEKQNLRHHPHYNDNRDNENGHDLDENGSDGCRYRPTYNRNHWTYADDNDNMMIHRRCWLHRNKQSCRRSECCWFQGECHGCHDEDD